MKRFWVVAVLALGFGLIACSDDTETKPTTDGKVTTDTSGKQDGTTTKQDGKTESDGTTAQGACTNTADSAKLDSDTKLADVKTKASACGVGCVAAAPDAGVGPCAVACIMEGAGLSQECAGCYAASVDCVATNCVAFCMLDPTATDCVNCQEGKAPSTTGVNCIEPFYTCSGLPKK